MKKILLLLSLILGTFSYGQNDCSQADGTFRYRVKINISNLPSDFDKDDFISHIVAFDNIPNNELEALIEHITSVSKNLPSRPSNKFVTIVATTEIYSILESLENSFEYLECVNSDCLQPDGTFLYITLLTNGNLSTDFDKDDFINYIIALDNISSEDLATLNTHITSVFKTFPTSQSEFLQRVITIKATTEIYFILDSLINSIEIHHCEEEVLLEIIQNQKNKNAIVYPNPITENSVIKLNSNSTNVRIEIINSLGQRIYQKRISGQTAIELKNLPIVNGIYFLKIYDLTSEANETLKIVKEK